MEFEVKPYWYKLIKKLKEKDKIKTGLTIPYIFGAYKILGEPIKNVDELLGIILNSETNIKPALQRCWQIEHIVLMLDEKKEFNRPHTKDIAFPNNSGKKYLFVSMNASHLGKTPAEVSKNLTIEYEKHIFSAKCSWGKNKNDPNGKSGWVEIPDDEIEIIKSLKSKI